MQIIKIIDIQTNPSLQLVPFSTEIMYCKRLAIGSSIMTLKEEHTTRSDGHQLNKRQGKDLESKFKSNFKVLHSDSRSK